MRQVITIEFADDEDWSRRAVEIADFIHERFADASPSVSSVLQVPSVFDDDLEPIELD